MGKIKILPGVPGAPVGTVSKDELLMSDKGPRWKTKEGEILSIKDMTDEHLTNAVNMLSKRRGHITSVLASINTTLSKLVIERNQRTTDKERARAAQYKAIKAAELAAKKAAVQAEELAAKLKVKPSHTGRRFRED
jgi:hypothetical protein